MEKENKSVRNSNVELMRIVAMLFVIMGHMLNQGVGTPPSEYIQTSNSILNCVFMGGARIAVNIFICITMWYMVDEKYTINKNIKKAVLLWLEMLLIPSVVTAVLWLFGLADAIHFIRTLFPLTQAFLWYVPCYIVFLLVVPVLQITQRHLQMNRGLYRAFIVVIFFVFCVVSTIFPIIESPYGSSQFKGNILWFCVVFFIIGYIKPYAIKLNGCSTLLFFLGGGIYALYVVCRIICYRWLGTSGNMFLLLEYYTAHLESLPNIACALLLTLGCIIRKERKVKIINKAAAPIITVYIYHQIEALYKYIWLFFRVERMFRELQSGIYFAFLFGVTVSVYMIGGLIHAFYKRIELLILPFVDRGIAYILNKGGIKGT